ncbi:MULTISPECIES: hypothetical protein [unclassified Mesorhizobium]|nr:MULTISPECIES: hypothetical protein [unclassified Mesorhizobium]TPJ57063.1 hypothetical protein FJ443_30445 [Mesorhizobium sp. B2-6-1]TPN34742.1 hypothetical protein FJ979_21380 [Mesorhizobium sp. B1-1-6]TPN79485.1 hypothetical protein FJ980_30970 [Mesorhizobium sp. B1-1-5]
MAVPKKVMNWSAKRASASITINGFNAKGEVLKITGVPIIEAGKKGKGPVVTDKTGTRFELVSS